MREDWQEEAWGEPGLRRSPSRDVPTFGKAERFIPRKSFSPPKFYDQPDYWHRGGAAIGYGQKVDIVLRSMNDPGKYNIRSEFDEIAGGYRFGVRPYSRSRSLRKDSSPPKHHGTPDHHLINRSTSSKHFPVVFGRKEGDHNGKSRSRENQSLIKSPSKAGLSSKSPCRATPNTRKQSSGSIRKELTQNRRKGPSRQGRGKGSPSENRRNESKSEQKEKKVPGRKTAYQLKYQYSQSVLLSNNRGSYTDFLLPKRDPRAPNNQQHHRPHPQPFPQEQRSLAFNEAKGRFDPDFYGRTLGVGRRLV